MMINTGELILAMAVFMSFAAAIASILLHKKPSVRKWTNIFLIASVILITFGMLLLIYYQVVHDFRFAYVYEHTSVDLAPAYLVSALWAGQEGSFFLWAVINSWIGLALWKALNKRGLQKRLAFTCFAIINISIMMMALLSQPFKTMTYVPIDGLGLNLALQDPWMAIHPPLVFIGYSSMAVLFSLGLGIRHEIEKSYEKAVLRRWALLGWFFLGMGIFTGSIWAYRALGWGGYWAWDPIENAALIPWLLLTGVAHGEYTVSKARNRIKYMLPFVMAAFGTFLARSGILKDISVHAYAGSSLSIPLFIFLVILVFIILYFGLSKAKRSETLKQHGGISIFSILNVILYAFAALISLGTVFPLISGTEATMAFFNYSALFFSIAFVLLFIAEYYTRFKEVFFRVLFVSAIITASICMSMKFASLIWLLMLWVLLIPLVLWVVNSVSITPTFHFKRIKNLSALVAHAGTILLILGAVTSTAFSQHGTILMAEGSSTNLGYGSRVESANLDREGSTTIHTIGADIILSPAGSGLSSSMVQAVNYTTRPLIWLFWIGGALIVLGSLGAIIRRTGLVTVSDAGDSPGLRKN